MKKENGIDLLSLPPTIVGDDEPLTYEMATTTIFETNDGGCGHISWLVDAVVGLIAYMGVSACNQK